MSFVTASQCNMSIRTRIVISVTFQKINCSPDTKSGTESYYKSLKNTDCTVEKCHKEIPPFV